MMLRKLYALVAGTIRPDNADALTSQEILLPGKTRLGVLPGMLCPHLSRHSPGHLYCMFLKEKLQDWLTGASHCLCVDGSCLHTPVFVAGIKLTIEKDIRLKPGAVALDSEMYITKCFKVKTCCPCTVATLVHVYGC